MNIIKDNSQFPAPSAVVSPDAEFYIYPAMGILCTNTLLYILV